MRDRTWLVVLGATAGVLVLGFGGMYLAHRPPEGGRNILTIAEPEVVESFQIEAEHGEVLWRIESTAETKLSSIHYGEVPPGFKQVVPSAGRPRAFRKDEVLKTTVLTPSRLFTHSGVALDEARFLGGGWRSGPREGQGAPP
jgi:hypothetical protein